MAMSDILPREQNDLDLKTLLLILWRKRWLLLSCVLISVLIGAFNIASTYPVYRADSLIQLEYKNQNPIIFQDPFSFGEEVNTSTEVEIISSRLVLGRAVAQHNLDWTVEPQRAPLIGNILARYDIPLPEWTFLVPYARHREDLTLNNLQVPPQWVGQELVLTVGPKGYRIELPDGSTHDGKAGADLTLGNIGFSINVASHPETPGRQYIVEQISEREAIQSLRDRLSIVEQGRSSGILELGLTGKDTREVEATLAAVANAYVMQNVSRSVAEAEGGRKFIESQLPEAENRLRDAQSALNRFREDASDRARSQDWLAEAPEQSFETQALLNQITRVEADLRLVEQEIAQNRSLYDEYHPMMRKSLSDREELQVVLTGLLAQVPALPEVEREIIHLTRAVELAQQIYVDLQTRYQEMQVLQASAVGSVRIIDPAATAPAPIAPRKGKIALSSLLGGLVIGAFLALTLHWTRKGIKGSQELEKSGLPVFATIAQSPYILQLSRTHSILALERPNDVTVESLRSLRTSLHFGMVGSSTKAVTLTSAAPGAGKTTTAVNLAVIAALAGQKVALVDADLRRGQVRKYFGLPRTASGLSEVLAGKQELASALVETSVQGLFVLPAGRYPPNPSELLMREEMTSLTAELSDGFDLVILDTPPTLAVTDPVIIGQLTGTIILVVRHGITPLGEIEAVKKVYQSSGLRLAGAVLNGFDPRKGDERDAWSGYDYQYSYETRKVR